MMASRLRRWQRAAAGARWALFAFTVASGAGCGDGATTAPAPSSSGDVGAASAVAASASAVVSPVDPSLPTITRTLPGELAQKDDAACASGDSNACRAMANRYRGYGAPAGCGIDRGPERPRIKRIAEDTDHDALRYQHHIDGACELGDDEACLLAERAEKSRNYPTHSAEDFRMRSRVEDSALYRYQKLTRKGVGLTMLDVNRKQCESSSHWWYCNDFENALYARDAKPKSELSPELRASALAICKETLECEEIAMMLDRSLYPLEEVTKLRHEMGGVLAEACKQGSCVCGEAASLLAEGDERWLALAKAGCDDGEAEGCFQLGRAYEEGRGVAKDEARARSLYELACPPTRPAAEWRDGPRQGEYAPRACDRLAALHEPGEGRIRRASAPWYYAAAACQRPGFERDHAPCLRLARYHWLTIDTGRNLEDTWDTARGRQSFPANRKECLRPSVAEACKELDELVAKGRPPK
jgi:hypothetical protein